jgi:hypothetical protein
MSARTILRSGTVIAATAISAAIITTTGVAAATSSAPAQPAKPETIQLQLHGGSVTFVNIRHKNGPATGDEYIGTQPAFTAAHPKDLVGHAFVVITLLTKSADRVEATLVLRQGQLDLTGIEASDPFTLAVTGGTGAFTTARGEATIKSRPGKSNPTTITVQLLS